MNVGEEKKSKKRFLILRSLQTTVQFVFVAVVDNKSLPLTRLLLFSI